MKVACHGCGKPLEGLVSLCDECRAGYASPTERPYDDAAWKRRSSAFLKTHAWCVLCRNRGLPRVPSKVADHWPRSRRELLAAGVADPDREEFLRPLCVSHHNARAASHTIRFDNDPA